MDRTSACGADDASSILAGSTCMTSLPEVMKFVSLLHRLQSVERLSITPTNPNRYENSTEHSYQVTMLVWYIMTTEKLDLDAGKVLRYALIHDIIEAYTGDIPIHDVEARKTKADQEAKAFEQFVQDYPEFTELHELIEQYEAREDEESKFVYAIDKLIDPINNSLNNMEPNRAEGWNMDLLKKLKADKVATHPTADRLFKEWTEYVQEKYPDF